MSGKAGIIFAGLLFAGLILGGCRQGNSARVDASAKMATDIRRAELQRELDKKWENPPVHFQMGQLYHAAGDWSKAEWYYNTALGYNPVYREVQAAMVKLQFDKGDKARGEWAANAYMTQAASSPEQLVALGQAFEAQQLDDYALKCYMDALKSAPNSPTINRQLGYYYLHRNRKDQAKEYFIRSFQLDANQPDVAGELGRLGVAVRIPDRSGAAENLSQPVRPANQPK